MLLDFLLRQHAENGIILGDDGHLHLTSLELLRHHCAETVQSHLQNKLNQQRQTGRFQRVIKTESETDAGTLAVLPLNVVRTARITGTKPNRSKDQAEDRKPMSDKLLEVVRQVTSSQIAYLNHFLVLQYRLRLQGLLQKCIHLRLLRAHSNAPEAAVKSSRIGLIQLRSLFRVVTDHHHGAAQRSHEGILRVNLVDIGQSPAQHVQRDLVAVLVLPFRSLTAGPIDLGASVTD